MKSLMVFTTVVALVLVGIAGIANADAEWTRDVTNTEVGLTNIGDEVGIGTDFPSAKLHVNTGEGWDKVLRLSGPYPSLYLDSGGTDWGLINTSAGIKIFQVGAEDRLIIKNDGNVGIGYSDQLYMGTGKLQINGKVGIGTTNPGANLEVEAANNPDILVKSGGTARASIDFSTETGANRYSVGAGYATNGDFAIKDEADNRYVFYANTVGNVGIGTDLPAAKLDVVGETITDELTLTLAGTPAPSDTVLLITTTGKVVDSNVSLSSLQAQITALQDAINDLPSGLTKIDRNGDGK